MKESEASKQEQKAIESLNGMTDLMQTASKDLVIKLRKSKAFDERMLKDCDSKHTATIQRIVMLKNDLIERAKTGENINNLIDEIKNLMVN